VKTIRFPKRVLLLAPVLCAGCISRPEVARPTVEAPVMWKEEAATVATTEARELPVAWWKIFGDPELNALEAQVVTANQDVQRALARVAESRSLARLSAADLTPSLSSGATSARQRASANLPHRAGTDREFSEHRTGFDLSYEIDLWGRNRHSANASRSEAFATEHEFAAVLLTMTSDAARHYYDVRALDAELRVIEATRALRRDTLALQSTRNRAGLINEVDVTRARAELAGIEAELHAAARRRARFEHALAVLCGQAPGAFSIAPRTESFAAPTIPVGLPSELLQRRPDIVAAEQRLDAAHSRIAVAKADFFPRISLTGSAGVASSDLNNLTRGNSGTWAFGPSVYLPIFDGGRNRANLGAAEARYEQSAAEYRNVVLTAFREVEDTLSDLKTLAQQREAVDRALAAARDTASLANERYQRGLTSYLDVVDAQRGVFDAERNEAQLLGQQAVFTIHLAKALGGGWQSNPAFAKQ
jgi:outer membrane protein, multidrug efflux system